MTICTEVSLKVGVGTETLLTRGAVKSLEANIPLSLSKTVGNLPPRVGTDPGGVLRSLVCTLLSIVGSPPCAAMFKGELSHVFKLLGGELDVVFALNDTLGEGVVSATATIFVCVSRPWCIWESITCRGFEHWPEDKMHSSFDGDHSSAEDWNILCSGLGTLTQQAFVDLHIAGSLGIAKTSGFTASTSVLHDA